MTEKDTAAHAKDLARRITEAEKSRAAGLEVVARISDARLDALRLERLRLTHKYGPEHPRVARISARIGDVTGAQRELAAELQRTTVPSQRPVEDAATLHGRVTDANQLGLGGLTVRARLADASKEIDKAATSDAGHFALSIPQRTPGEPHVSVTLEIQSGNHRVVHRDAEPRQLAVGAVAYAEMEIADRARPRAAAAEEPEKTEPPAGAGPPRPRPAPARPAKKR